MRKKNKGLFYEKRPRVGQYKIAFLFAGAFATRQNLHFIWTVARPHKNGKRRREQR